MRPPRPRPLLACLATIVALLALPASGLAAGATIGAVDCDAGGAVATLRNDSGGPARFTVLRDDVAIATAVIPAGGAPVTRIVPIAEGAAAQVTVKFGSSYASSYVRRSCDASGAAASTSTVQVTAGGASPAPVVPGTGVRAAEQQPQEAPDRSTGEVTLEDAAWTWPLLLVAAMALVLAAALLVLPRIRARVAARDLRRHARD